MKAGLSTEDGFAVEILRDLVSQGVRGKALLEKFIEMQAGIQKAMSTLLAEADDIAAGKRESATTEDIFWEVL